MENFYLELECGPAQPYLFPIVSCWFYLLFNFRKLFSACFYHLLLFILHCVNIIHYDDIISRIHRAIRQGNIGGKGQAGTELASLEWNRHQYMLWIVTHTNTET